MSSELYGISVLMSVYKNENPVFLAEAIKSIIHQTRKPDEIVIIEDGPLTVELNEILEKLQKEYKNLIFTYKIKNNIGLGLALKFGVEKCRYPLIARMDTDDIAYKNRLELQEEAFLKDDKLDIIGGHISEFVDDYNNPVSIRSVPLQHDEIVKFQKRRSAFNHMTVMFKKTAVLKAGNYEHGLYMEDDLLWNNMLSIDSKAQNLDCVLCYVRVGNGMYERRGGLNYFNHYKAARKTMLNRSQISKFDYYYSLVIQFLVALVPTSVRKFIFRKLLRG
ncbi:glycosyltransferase [Streptococcus suis]|nr:glycosyltransferase [Streptococcus suis]NQH96554.1 glycosyltransferase [Streptococcus suis]NQI33803.1 glycosyltransferase [Streptococcus suis]